MGSGCSRFVSLADVARARDRLLIAVGRRSTASASALSWLAGKFQCHDSTRSGSVPIGVVAEILEELELGASVLSAWTSKELVHFCAFFSRDQDGAISNSFNYTLFLDYLFFPSLEFGSQLEIHPTELDSSGFQVGTMSRSLKANQRPPPDNQATSTKVIVKEIDLASISGDVSRMRDTINNLRLLMHQNLVNYCSTLQCKSSLYVLQILAPKTCTLRTILESFGPMKESTVRRYLVQLLQALLYLHQHQISHGALSTQSILIDSYGLLKVADFGLHHFALSSGQVGLWKHPTEYNSIGNDSDWCLQFKPPEIDEGNTWGLQSDIWCVGVLGLQMTHGIVMAANTTTINSHPPSPSPTKRGTRGRAQTTSFRRPPTLPASASTELKALVRACLQKSPSKRASVEDLLKSDYFHIDPNEAKKEELRTVCADLDASIKRLLSASSPSTRAEIRRETARRATTARGY